MCRPNLTLLIFTALNTHREDFNFKFFEALKIIAEGLFLMLASLKKTRQQLWLNERTGQKPSSNMIAFAAHTSYQKRFNKVLSFVVNISRISRICRV